MSPAQVVRTLEACESQFRVDQWTLMDFWAWPLFRVKLELAVLGGEMPNESIGPSVRGVSRVRQALGTVMQAARAILNWRIARRKAGAATPYVLALSGGPYTALKGRSYDNNVGPMAEWLQGIGVETEVLTWCGDDFDHVVPTQSISDQLHDLGSLGLLVAKLHRISKWELPDFPGVIQFLTEAGIPAWAIPSPDWLLIQAWKTNVVSWYFESLIRHAPPVGIVPVSFYCDYGFAITLAGWRQGIPTVDLTHGVQGHSHGAYTRWRQIDPSVCNLRTKGFLCWTEFDASCINQWAGAPVADSLGSPILTAWQESPVLQRFQAEVKTGPASVLFDGHKPAVLVTLWPLHSEDDIQLRLILKLVEVTPEWTWWFRLHPSQLNSTAALQILGDKGIDLVVVKAASTIPLPALLLAAQALLTRFSSTVIEASLADLPCVVIGDRGRSLFSEYSSADAPIHFVDSMEEAHGLLKDIPLKRKARRFVALPLCKRHDILKKHFLPDRHSPEYADGKDRPFADGSHGEG